MCLSIYLFADVDFPLVGSWSSEEIDSCILVKQVQQFAAHLHPKNEKNMLHFWHYLCYQYLLHHDVESYLSHFYHCIIVCDIIATVI